MPFSDVLLYSAKENRQIGSLLLFQKFFEKEGYLKLSSYIEFKDVYKRYQMGESVVSAADGVSFNIEEGEFAVILGASGAGKTTVLNMLGGIDTCNEGSITVAGRSVDKLSEKELIMYRRNDVGFVFQFYNLIQNLTAKENVELATQICENHMDVDEVLEQVGLKDRKNNFPAQLSGGEQQRVAIARAIAHSPKVLFADEPTGALDTVTGLQVVKIFKELTEKEGVTVVMTTHDTGLMEIGDVVYELEDGEVVHGE